MKINISKLMLAGLMGAVGTSALAAQPVIMGYYANWDEYNKYPMPNNAQSEANDNLTSQISGLNTLAYAFLETITPTYANQAGIPANQQNAVLGSVRFSDAYSDLNASNSNDNSFCNAYPASCGVYSSYQGKFLPWPSSAQGGYGNFQAFANQSGVKKVISIGGAGHDDSWETVLTNTTYQENFINSLVSMVKSYGIDGVDIDYEPVAGIPSQYTDAFVNLVSAMRQALPKGTILTWAIIGSPNFVNALSSSQWAALSNNLTYINIMGYDMAGEFSTPAVTALHSALYPVAPGEFNDDAMLSLLNSVGIKNSQIILGVPFYGRAVSGAAAAGLNQAFTSVPQGDLDVSGCSTVPNQGSSCSGMFSYQYLAANYQPNETGAGDQDSGAWAYDGSKGMFVSYDSPASMKAKADYINGTANRAPLAGIMLWALRYDAPTYVNGDLNSQSLLSTIDKVYGITPVKPGPGPAPSGAGEVIVYNNNQVAVGSNDSINVILQEGNGPLWSAPTVSIQYLLAATGRNSIMQSPAAFGNYSGPLTVWSADVSNPNNYIKCSTQTLPYSPSGKTMSVYVWNNGAGQACSSNY